LEKVSVFAYCTNDPLGNLLNTAFPGLTVQFNYDAANRLTNMVDGIGTTRYSYDAMGLLASEDGPRANDMVSYVNLANQMRGQMQLAQPTVPAWLQTYAYDAANRLSAVTSPAGSFGYSYSDVGTGNSPGGLISTPSLPNGAYITNTFDAVGREAPR
jgi:YD repeat-containing protein